MKKPKGLRALLKFLSIVYNVPRAKEAPPGLMIVAPPAQGKSFSLTMLKGDGWRIVSDITASGVEQLIREIKHEWRGFIVVPDFLRALSRAHDALFSLLNLILEEGITEIRKYGFQMKSEEPIRIGFITAVTDSEFEKIKDEMEKLGLLSRMLTFHFTYAPSDKRVAEEEIAEGVVYDVIELPSIHTQYDVKMTKESVNEILRLARRLPSKASFRIIKNIRKLSKALAVSKNKLVVTEDIVKEVAIFLPFLFQKAIGSDLTYIILYKLLKGGRVTYGEGIGSYTEQEVSEEIRKLSKLGLVKVNEYGYVSLNI